MRISVLFLSPSADGSLHGFQDDGAAEVATLSTSIRFPDGTGVTLKNDDILALADRIRSGGAPSRPQVQLPLNFPPDVATVWDD